MPRINGKHRKEDEPSSSPLMTASPLKGSPQSNTTNAPKMTVSAVGLVLVTVGLVVYVQISLNYLEMKVLGAINGNSDKHYARKGILNSTGGQSVNPILGDASSFSLSTTMEEKEKVKLGGMDCSLPHESKNEDAAGTTTTNNNEYSLPSCKDLMNSQGSAYRDGQFLTRHTIPVSWHPRKDNSKELRHSICRLHRYTAEEARSCLAGKHLFMAGDSVSRYQFVSLATFLHTGHYPPRFGKDPNCPHINDQGKPACSPADEPNVCMEGQWQEGPKDAWMKLFQAIGGYLFDGYMEASSIRQRDVAHAAAENYLYYSPPDLETSTTSNTSNETMGEQTTNSDLTRRIILSFSGEAGWANTPDPVHGFDFTGCGKDGTCNYTDELWASRLERHRNMSYDFSEPFEDAIGPNGCLRKQLPPVDIALYNRGLWGVLGNETKNKILFDNLHTFSKGEQGRCFFRSTTGRLDKTLTTERDKVRKVALGAGCGYLDNAHLVEDFSEILFQHPAPPKQMIGGRQTIVSAEERKLIFWDSVHFQPWVYEELNNMQLNVLCNPE